MADWPALENTARPVSDTILAELAAVAAEIAGHPEGMAAYAAGITRCPDEGPRGDSGRQGWRLAHAAEQGHLDSEGKG